MQNIKLVRPTKELEKAAIDFKNEFFQNGEYEINGSELWDKTDSYDIWLENVTKNSCKETVNPNWVVTDTFFAVRECDNHIIGIIDFRNELNDFLKDFGHCGYSVRPTERKKGYATEMLKQIIDLARQIGLKEMQLSCVSDNEPSVKTITNNGGIYQRSFLYEEKKADIFLIKPESV